MVQYLCAFMEGRLFSQINDKHQTRTIFNKHLITLHNYYQIVLTLVVYSVVELTRTAPEGRHVCSISLKFALLARVTRKKILFTDWRDIQCGAVAWLTAEGEHYRVSTPPEPQVPMRAEPRLVPRGIRLQAQPARKAGKMEGYGGWGQSHLRRRAVSHVVYRGQWGFNAGLRVGGAYRYHHLRCYLWH